MIQYYAKTNPKFMVDRIEIVSESFEEFLQKLSDSSHAINIYILDMDLSASINGLQIAKRIRSFDFHGYIIFLTAHIEMTALTYQYNLKALNFIYKGDPKLRHSFFSSLEQICLEQDCVTIDSPILHHASNNLIFSYKFNHFIVAFHDILYIETHSSKRCLLIHTTDRIYEYPHTLVHLKNELPSFFHTTHRCHIVNTQWIKEVRYQNERYELLLDNGTLCPVSKKYISNLVNLLKSQGK